MAWTIFGGERACPACAADPGKPCTSRNGNPLSTSHAARFREQQATTCRHCSRRIIPGYSSTGWVHDHNRRSRCDGQILEAAGRTRAELAVPA